MYYNPKWIAKEYLWLIFFKAVVAGKNCPKCKLVTRPSSVWKEDVEKVGSELGLDIVRKIAETLNKLAEDSS